MRAISQKIRRPILLVGFMGAGKSAAGSGLAARLGVPFTDLDEAIERETGRTIAALFDESGEAAFRLHEGAALERALVAFAEGGVLAAGGGLYCEATNRARLAAGRALVVWLDVPLAEITRRLAGDVSRPLFRDPAEVDRLYRSRSADYAGADVRIDASGADPEGVVDRICAALGRIACAS